MRAVAARRAPIRFDGTEEEGWRAIAELLTRALGWSVCVKTAQRYAEPTFPSVQAPRPLPIGQRGNGVRFVRLDAELMDWVAWFRGRPGERRRPAAERGGDRRRAA
jgi:hypothetical protein